MVNDNSAKVDIPEEAVDILRELRVNPNFIPPYRAECMKKCIAEIKRLRKLNADTLYVNFIIGKS